MCVLVATSCRGESSGDGGVVVARAMDLTVPVDSMLSLEREVTLQEDSVHLIANPTDAVYAPWGTLYVADLQMREVKAFGEDGRFLGVLGRSGAGPGEYNAPIDVGVSRGPDRVRVFDASRDRVVVFERDSMTATSTREFMSELLIHSVVVSPTGSLFLIGVNTGYQGKPKGDVALSDSGTAQVKYLLPRPSVHQGKGIAVNIASAVGAPTANGVFLGHMLFPRLYRAAWSGELLDSITLPESVLRAAVLPDTVPRGRAAMLALTRSMNMLTRLDPVDDSTIVLSIRVFDHEADEIRYRIGVLRWDRAPRVWLTDVCDCRVVGVNGSTVSVLTGGPPEPYVLQHRTIAAAVIGS